jgi:hypothetical protein
MAETTSSRNAGRGHGLGGRRLPRTGPLPCPSHVDPHRTCHHHADTPWPHSQAAVKELLSPFPHDEVRRIIHVNAERLFRRPSRPLPLRRLTQEPASAWLARAGQGWCRTPRVLRMPRSTASIR